MSEVIPTSSFKKQFKKVKNNPRWKKIFNGNLPFSNKSSWDYVISFFLNDTELPGYFYEHKITLTKQVKKQIKQRLKNENIEVAGLDLHFDGHNGDHLLIYCRIPEEKLVYLLAIGTHSELF